MVKPKNVKIVSFQAMAVPSLVSGGVNIIIFGIGSDEKIYQWNNEQWTYETK